MELAFFLLKLLRTHDREQAEQARGRALDGGGPIYQKEAGGYAQLRLQVPIGRQGQEVCLCGRRGATAQPGEPGADAGVSSGGGRAVWEQGVL